MSRQQPTGFKLVPCGYNGDFFQPTPLLVDGQDDSALEMVTTATTTRPESDDSESSAESLPKVAVWSDNGDSMHSIAMMSGDDLFPDEYDQFCGTGPCARICDMQLPTSDNKHDICILHGNPTPPISSTINSNKWWIDWLYPPYLPRTCQLLRRENLAIPACYLLVGLVQGLSSPLIQVYPLDLGATESQQTTISAIRTLPSTLKLVFGFLSDARPIRGYKRKPYMLIGALLMSGAFLVLLLGSTDTESNWQGQNQGGCQPHSSASDGKLASDFSSVVFEDGPTIGFLSVCILAAGTGLWLADVIADSLCCEKSKLEPPESGGSIQTSCYAYRFLGTMLAAPIGTWMYSELGPMSIVAVLVVLPLLLIPLICLLDEVKNAPVTSASDQCREIYNTVCSRQVWQPMGFVFLYNVLQVSNAAWKQFLRTNLGFTSCQFNALMISSSILLFLGIVTYKNFLSTWSWRSVYVLCSVFNGIFSALQVLLVQGKTLGLPPVLFAFGDDAFRDFLEGAQIMPLVIMMVHLVPAGSEGASYAMFTTATNSAYTLSVALSTMLLGVWDVSEEALGRQDLRGLTNLTVMTTAMQLSGILFVGFLPRHKEDLEVFKILPGATSHVGGSIFLLVTFSSMGLAVVVGLINIVAPGFMGTS